MPSKYRSIVELDIFKAQVGKLAVSVQSLDEALHLVTWAVSKNPRAFDEVPGLADCYIAKTESWTTSGGVDVPALRVFFRIEDEDTVSLCAISKIR